jgi:uncharacterized membrane protein
MPLADPWYDYLALPIAPLVLLVQFGALFVRPWWLRWGLSVACFAAILVMLAYVASIPVGPDEGVNIGAGVMALWFLCSFVLALVLVARDVILMAFLAVRSRSADRDAKPSQ